MPKIDINAAPNVNSQGATRRADAAVFGGGGRALQQAGQDVAAFAAQIKAQNDKSTAVEIEKSLIDADAQLTQQILQLEDKAAPGGAGHVDKVNGLLSERSEAFLDQYGSISPENRQRLELGLARMRWAKITAATRFQASQHAFKVRKDAENGLDQLLNNVRDGSTPLNEAMESASALIGATGLDDKSTSQMNKSFSSAAAASAIQRELDDADTPEETVALKAQAEAMKGQFSPPMYDRVLKQIDNAEERLRVKEQTELRADLKNVIILEQNGKSTGASLAQEDFDKAYDDKSDAVDAFNIYQRARSEGVVVTQVNSMSVTEIDQHRRKLESRADNQKQSAEDRLYALDELRRFDGHVRTRQAKFKRDQVKFVTEHNPTVQRHYDAWMMAEEHRFGGVDVPEARPDEADITVDLARQKYVENVRAAQVQMGAAPDEIELLPPSAVAAFEASVANVDKTPEGADKLLKFFGEQQALWGADWPTAYQQLVKKGALVGGHVPLSRLAGDPNKMNIAKDTAVALTIDLKSFQNHFPEGETAISDTRTKVREVLKDLEDTLTPQLGGFDQYKNFHDVITQVALYKRTRNSMTLDDAVEYAANKMILEDYDFYGTYRVPKSNSHNGSLISKGAAVIKQTRLGDLKGKIIPPIGMTEENALISLSGYGKWITSPKEDGLVLVGAQGQPVALKSGGFVSYSWHELQDAGTRSRPKNTSNKRSRDTLKNLRGR